MSSGSEENFIRGYVRLNEGTEIPPIFAMWCALAGISCALGRRVWLDMGTYKIYPNLYTVLVAGSGRMRKSTAVNQIKGILRKLAPSPNIIAQKITPEALIEAMRVVSADPKNLLQETATGFVLVDELSTFLNKSSYEAGLAPLLIQFFDCEEYFEYRTKGRGQEILNHVCMGLLAASTVDWIRNAIPIDAVGGGLTSRMIFVYVDTPTAPVAVTTFNDEKKKLLGRLIEQLGTISSIKGEAKMTENALKLYVHEYEKWHRSAPFFDDKNLQGYASRRNMHMLKLAMCISASQRNDRIITEQDIAGARALLESSESSMKLVLNLITASETGNVMGMVLQLIRGKTRMPRSDLLQAVSHRVGARELNEVIDTLIAMGQLEMNAEGRSIYYVAKKG